MAAAKVQGIPKLLAVTLVRSGIRKPYWEKRTLKALGLTKLHKTVIHKNIPSVNGQLNSVKHLISIQTVEVDATTTINHQRDDKSSVFLTQDGLFNVNKYLKYRETVQHD